MKKKIFKWILVIIWMGIIFIFSSMNSNESDASSKGLIYTVMDKIVDIFDISVDNREEVIDKLNYPVRKIAHFTEYLILSLLLFNAMGYDTKKFFIIIFICFIYACTDEFHQLFISGRSGQLGDVMIDTLGGIFGNLFMYFKRRD